jgi:uncharacterized protein YdeI (YjbR/CyaY-like superfamily)
LSAKVLFLENAADFRRWLETHAASSEVLQVGFYRKTTGKPSITYSEALDEALCFGWIDGVRKSLNADAYSVRFTPRRAKSRWSAVNIRRAKALKTAGRMHANGLKALEGANDSSRGHSYEDRNQASFARGEEKKFRGNQKAWDFFQAQPPWYRRTTTFWVISAKGDETRKNRLETLIDDCAASRYIKGILSPPVPKRSRKSASNRER